MKIHTPPQRRVEPEYQTRHGGSARAGQALRGKASATRGGRDPGNAALGQREALVWMPSCRRPLAQARPPQPPAIRVAGLGSGSARRLPPARAGPGWLWVWDCLPSASRARNQRVRESILPKLFGAAFLAWAWRRSPAPCSLQGAGERRLTRFAPEPVCRGLSIPSGGHAWRVLGALREFYQPSRLKALRARCVR